MFRPEHDQPFRERRRCTHGDAADHDARDPTGTQVLDIVSRAHAAAGLDVYAGCRDLCKQVELCGFADACAVEIDDMQPVGAGIGIARRERDSIVIKGAHLREIALTQAHDAPAEKVDRWNDLQVRAKKFVSRRRPAAADFSG